MNTSEMVKFILGSITPEMSEADLEMIISRCRTTIKQKTKQIEWWKKLLEPDE